MRYGLVRAATLVERKNRFVAEVLLDGHIEQVHVKNTGRCRELLVPGCTVYLAEGKSAVGTLIEGKPAEGKPAEGKPAEGKPAERKLTEGKLTEGSPAGGKRPGRKTRWDLIAVEKETRKGTRLINMDAQAPNAAAEEWLRAGNLIPDGTGLRREVRYGASRFDFALTRNGTQGFLEVKGVTLEEDGAVFFPDAPTERGVKHVRELIRCAGEGREAWLLFVIQMEGVRYFSPNRRTHPAFADALTEAREAGVVLLAYDCTVTPDSMELRAPVEIRLDRA